MTSRDERARQAVDTHVGFGHFIRAVTHPPLLRADQEANLGKRVAAGDVARTMLSPEELVECTAPEVVLRRVTADGEAALRRLIESNTRLAVRMARAFQSGAATRAGNEYDIEERVQEALIGLARAAAKFDPTKGYRFTTYASWWIRQSLQRGAYRTGSVRIPAHMWEQLGKLWTARYKITDAGGVVKAATLAMVSGLPRDKVEKLLELEPQLTAVRLDRPMGDDLGSATVAEMLSDAVPGPEAQAVQVASSHRLEAYLSDLPPRQRHILMRRFGFDGRDEATLEELGVELGLTRERVRQLQNEALSHLGGHEELKELL